MTDNINKLMDRISVEIAGLDLGMPPVELYEPVGYCLSLGGKRMRPLMTLLGCELFGGEADTAMPAAIGLELFHNFTLMHDDIMDNAPIRRGKPAVHMKWNANTAILSGDVMFALAYQYMFKVPDQHLREVVELFNKTVLEVCEGQQYDMNFESMVQVTEEEYLEMIRLKTAVLPAACLKAGAIIAGASHDDADNLYRFGETVGLAFQLKDDWLDVFGDEAVFGKKSGGDILANKKTWLYIKALELANERQRELLLKGFGNLIADPDEKIRVVKDVYHSLEIGQLALGLIKSYHDRAFEYLDRIDVPAAAKEDLLQLATGLLHRST